MIVEVRKFKHRSVLFLIPQTKDDERAIRQIDAVRRRRGYRLTEPLGEWTITNFTLEIDPIVAHEGMGRYGIKITKPTTNRSARKGQVT